MHRYPRRRGTTGVRPRVIDWDLPGRVFPRLCACVTVHEAAVSDRSRFTGTVSAADHGGYRPARAALSEYLRVVALRRLRGRPGSCRKTLKS